MLEVLGTFFGAPFMSVWREEEERNGRWFHIHITSKEGDMSMWSEEEERNGRWVHTYVMTKEEGMFVWKERKGRTGRWIRTYSRYRLDLEIRGNSLQEDK